MIKITNPVAEQEARRLARDYEEHVLGVLSTALVPEKTRWQFLNDLRVLLTGAGGKFMSASYEHVQIIAGSGDVPDEITRTALGELSLIGTADLGHQLTLDCIAEAQSARRAELVARAEKLAGARLRRFKSRRTRRHEWAEHLIDALDSLESLPATGVVFEEAFRSVLHAAGAKQTDDGYALIDPGEAEALGNLTAADLGDEYLPEQIKRCSADQMTALRDRWETILVWMYEATHDEGDDETEGFEPGPRKRFGASLAAARARAKQEAEARAAERRRVEEQERVERRRRREHLHAHEQAEAAERRRRAIEQLRRNPPHVEPDEAKDVGKDGDWEPGF